MRKVLFLLHLLFFSVLLFSCTQNYSEILSEQENNDSNNNSQFCGNNFIENGEICDGTALNGQECIDINAEFVAGELFCLADCSGWDTSDCEKGFVNNCGDGISYGDEECDDGNTVSLDGCSSSCTIEEGWDCVNADAQPTVCTGICGDGILVQDEQCDDGALQNDDGCSDQCLFEPGWDCTKPPGEIAECEENCGDGLTVGEEVCDLSDLKGNDCTTINQGYTGGTLQCNSQCNGWNTDSCY